MTKIVYNNCYGGFGLSEKAVLHYAKLKGITCTFNDTDIARDDSILAQVVEELGPKANGAHACLCIRELESGTKYIIDEDDGMESILTDDELDWKIA